MNKITRCVRNLINTHNRSLFLIELTFLILFLLFILPILNLGIEVTIQIWGQSYITSENVLSYLTTPTTLIFLIIMIVLFSYFLLYQLITIIYFCYSEKEHEKISLINLMSISFQKLKYYFHIRYISYSLFTIPLFLSMNLPVLVVIILQSRMNFPNRADLAFFKIFLLLFFTIISLISYKGMFVVHLLLEEGHNFMAVIELSKKRLKGHGIQILKRMFRHNLLLTFGYLLCYYVILLIAGIFIILSVRKTMVVTVFLSVYPRINSILLILFLLTAFLANFNLVNSFYAKYNKVKDKTSSFIIAKEEPAKQPILKKSPRNANGFIILILLAGLVNAYFTVRNDSSFLQEALSGIQVSSHRGNSHVAPENTLPALENAIIARSDYAEIDIRQTKDGVLVLMHDSSLKRTAGVNKKIGSTSLSELTDLDAGSWFSKDFMYTRIPTLEEVLNYCKGKIKLNIEVKSSNKGPEFEENLVELIKEYDFENSCLISSSDYKTLVKIKQLDEELRTGLIIKYAYGNFYNMNVDFFSIRSRYINRQIVENAHRNGKEVHAWTVNSVSEIERMKSVGVDCIITDNPTLTKSVLFQDDSRSTFIKLLIRIIRR